MDAWLALERQTLTALAGILVVAMVAGWRCSDSRAGLLAAAVAGAIFYIWIAGLRHIVPAEVLWTFKLDWRIHFLGWHFFRQEPWLWPPGRIESYMTPVGTAIGFTDSVPLAAMLLKLFSRALPMPAQYLGAWLLLCFILQGFFGALIARRWSPHVLVQLLSACAFILVPSLLMRLWHPALCAHWLLLWPLWLYFRADQASRSSWAHVAACSLAAGLVHPYIAVMVVALIGAISCRAFFALRVAGPVRAFAHAALLMALGSLGIFTGWWASGLFTVTGVANLASEGLGRYSMNLLAPVTPTGWSTLLPEWPVATDGQTFEGFQYFGAGLLLLVAVAALVRVAGTSRPRVVWWSPMTVVALLLATYALSPRVTFGNRVIVVVPAEWLEDAAVFRSTSRFFWPAAYLLITWALATLLSRLPIKHAVLVLAAVVGLQLIDLRNAHWSRRGERQLAAWYEWPHQLASPVWSIALPHYDRLVLYPPPQCGVFPVPWEAVALLAGTHHLSINGGSVARFDKAARRNACHALERSLNAGEVRSDTMYLGNYARIRAFQSDAREPLTCGVLDGLGVCVTADSYVRWQDQASLK